VKAPIKLYKADEKLALAQEAREALDSEEGTFQKRMGATETAV
jgi:hypothetical protein